MANRYTGSPLGLVNQDFGGSNNPYTQKSSIEVKDASGNVLDSIDNPNVGSLFSSKHTIFKRSNQSNLADPLSFESPSVIHEDSIYNISTTNIINILNQYPAMRVKSSDFVYCKNYGVYPNNRLIICRRFPSIIGDDLSGSSLQESNTTLITWFSDQENPIEFDFGEEWIQTNDTLKDVLNGVGKDALMQIGGLGDIASRFGDAMPLPGITEVFQRQVLEKIGIIDNQSSSRLPSGDPNLIMESSRRKTIGTNSPGSGLVGKFNVKVKCAWEQKFINGIDPTFVYYDIVRTILSFGGSSATFYLGKNSRLVGGVESLLTAMSNPDQLMVKINEYIKAMIESISLLSEKISKFLSGEKPEDESNTEVGGDDVQIGLDRLLKSLPETIARKYKIPILGILNYLTGTPSGPWHVTIGNPMRPILSSGDMICKNVNVKLGPQLAFNDLPSSIECEFTLESSRNLGIDEIFGKLSSGNVRVTVPGNVENSIGSSFDAKSFHNSEPPFIDPSQSIVNQSNQQPNDQGEQDNNSGIGNSSQTKIGNQGNESGDSIVRDANSITTTTEQFREDTTKILEA